MWLFSQLSWYYYCNFARPMYDTRFSYPKVATMYRKRLLNPKVIRVVTLGTLSCDLSIICIMTPVQCFVYCFTVKPVSQARLTPTESINELTILKTELVVQMLSNSNQNSCMHKELRNFWPLVLCIYLVRLKNLSFLNRSYQYIDFYEKAGSFLSIG